MGIMGITGIVSYLFSFVYDFTYDKWYFVAFNKIDIMDSFVYFI